MVFVSSQKLSLFSRYLNFCRDFLVMQKKRLIRKIRLSLKFMTSQLGEQTITIHTLPNISRSKDDKKMKFGQLIEYNMRKNFLEKSYTKYDVETIPRTFPKKSHASISLDEYFKVSNRLFLLFVNLRAI